MEKDPKIKIFVTHFNKPEFIYEDDVFVPIQAGKKNSKIDLGIQGDDTGDNISEKNSQYAELTTQYRVWKNYDLSDVDYVGFCHYRRYMVYNYKYNRLKFWNNFNPIDRKHLIRSIFSNIKSILSYLVGWNIKYAFNTSMVEKFSRLNRQFLKKNLYDIYSVYPFYFINAYPNYHCCLKNQKLWKSLYDIIVDEFPDYKETIKNIEKCRRANGGNIGIFKKDVFQEYSKWLFTILFRFEKELKDKKLLDLGFDEPITAGTRFLGCVGERLFNLWIARQREKGLKISRTAKMVFFE